MRRNGTPVAPDRSHDVLRVSEQVISRIARQRLEGRTLVGIVLHQALAEAAARVRTKLSFRSGENPSAVSAYIAMNRQEFEGINARQRWANWRTIPRNLNGRLPNRPLKAIDLCCGVGHSTEVLAVYLAPGSAVLGLEINPRFVELARARQLLDGQGQPAQVEFHAQSVLDPFCDARGKRVAPQSVDLVNCSGAIGHHFRPADTQTIVGHITDVLRPGGMATIDSGADGTRADALERIFRAAGYEVLSVARSIFLDRYPQLCFRKQGGTSHPDVTQPSPRVVET